MKIDTTKMRFAEKVLGFIKSILKDKKLPNIYASLQAYQNGREQGYALMCYTEKGPFQALWIGFSENRNSDSIVVYADNHDPMQATSEEAYKSASYFSYGEYEKAATYIVEQLESLNKIAELAILEGKIDRRIQKV